LTRRKEIWLILADVENLRKNSPFKFDELKAMKNKYEPVILKDITRTYADKDYFNII